jgi:hypothetical protein
MDMNKGGKQMKRMIHVRKTAVALAGVMMMALLTGCSTLNSKGTSTSSGAAAPAATVAENAPVYYDFGDVMLPRELKVDKGDSFIMSNGGMTSGALILKGNVDSASLVSFFKNKMPVDGWRQRGSFSSARSIMLFEKPNRWCVILITDGTFSTRVEIWVEPTSEAMAH